MSKAAINSLSHGGSPLEQSQVGISSLLDTWLLLRDIELGGERNRGLCIVKSRGMAHSNQIREFLLTGHGVELNDVYVGPEGVLTGPCGWRRRRASRSLPWPASRRSSAASATWSASARPWKTRWPPSGPSSRRSRTS